MNKAARRGRSVLIPTVARSALASSRSYKSRSNPVRWPLRDPTRASRGLRSSPPPNCPISCVCPSRRFAQKSFLYPSSLDYHHTIWSFALLRRKSIFFCLFVVKSMCRDLSNAYVQEQLGFDEYCRNQGMQKIS